MALHHAVLFITLIFVGSCLANMQGRREPKYLLVRTPQQRLTRGINSLKYHNMQLSTARGYGKRATDMHKFNNFLREWIAIENQMRDLGMGKHLLRDQETLPE